MRREIKIWGERWLIREDSTHAVSFLSIREGYECSWHRHDAKYNLFVVLSGMLTLRVEELGEIRERNICSGEEFTVKPGQWHKFQCISENTTAIEEMYVEYDESDIIRESKGGKL